MVLMDIIKLVILLKLIALKDFYTSRLEAQYKLSLVMFNATSQVGNVSVLHQNEEDIGKSIPDA